jgi:hypothetical protein
VFLGGEEMGGWGDANQCPFELPWRPVISYRINIAREEIIKEAVVEVEKFEEAPFSGLGSEMRYSHREVEYAFCNSKTSYEHINVCMLSNS